MWFKQLQLFQLTPSISSSANLLAEKLEPLAFNPCLPSMPSSLGWVSPVDEENSPLTRGINGCIMICLQVEEKILPASVVAQTLKEKIKQIELLEARKVRQKEKLSFKDEITHTLLPRAFSKLTRLYAYIDTKNNWLILNTISPVKTELFISMLKKSLNNDINAFEIIKPSSLMTEWLKNKNHPSFFSIEKSCLLRDKDQQNRVIRCQEQDLFDVSILSLVKSGCEVMQMGLCWHDKLHFVIGDDFSLRTIRLVEDDMAEFQDQIESKQQKFDAEFFMMTDMYNHFLHDLLAVFAKNKARQEVKKLALVG